MFEYGIHDVDKVYDTEEMVSGPALFAATGVTNGEYLRGVQFFKGGAVSHSVVNAI